jgi:hypothetical protein
MLLRLAYFSAEVVAVAAQSSLQVGSPGSGRSEAPAIGQEWTAASIT